MKMVKRVLRIVRAGILDVECQTRDAFQDTGDVMEKKIVEMALTNSNVHQEFVRLVNFNATIQDAFHLLLCVMVLIIVMIIRMSRIVMIAVHREDFNVLITKDACQYVYFKKSKLFIN